MSIVVNPLVESMQGYVPGEQLNDPGIIKLNTNEAAYPAAPAVYEAIAAETARQTLSKYPDPSCSTLRTAIADRYGISPDEVVCGNGSDEILRLIMQAFTRPGAGDKIAVGNPTYTLYAVLASMFGLAVETFPAEAPLYSLPEALIETPAKIVFLPNPNPPIGTFYPRADLECLAAADPNRLIVIDEAYVDFAPNDALEVYRKYENIVLTRTFSKSYAMAGLRAGFAICRPELAVSLNKIKDSYNVNAVTQAAALAAWMARDYYKENIARVLEDRIFLVRELKTRGFLVAESHGNFVFARKAGAKKMYEVLKQRKVLVRYFDLPGLKDGLRISIGTHAQLEQLLKNIDEASVAL